jgi:F0F1-type ATP synthase epsilon subunit
MSVGSFYLSVSGYGATVFEGEAWQISAVNPAGGFSVRANHEPMLCSLCPGTLEIALTPQERQRFSIDGGILDFAANRCTVVAGRATSIDTPTPSNP